MFFPTALADADLITDNMLRDRILRVKGSSPCVLGLSGGMSRELLGCSVLPAGRICNHLGRCGIDLCYLLWLGPRGILGYTDREREVGSSRHSSLSAS